MKIVFCLDDKPQYLMLLKGAVRSLRRVYGPDVPCLCVYGGKDEGLAEAVRAENIPLAWYKTPVLNYDSMPQRTHRVMGAFLKLELALLPELAAEDYVLYCDTDVYFHRPIDELLAMTPTYMGMAKEETAPFHHDFDEFTYTYKEREYTVPLPFPIWTHNSGIVLFNLARLRAHDYIHNFLAFCMQTADRIGNFDQSMLNYFFGKRITRFDQIYNCPPYMTNSKDAGRIIHFHGPKPWETQRKLWTELRINHYEYFRKLWLELMTEEEKSECQGWDVP